MTTIAVTNRKGGVGKTSQSTHIAAGLATVGYRVGLVDTDSQGHCASILQMPREDGLFRVMVENIPIQEAVFEVPAENYSTADLPSKGALYLLPSADRTHKIPHELSEGQDIFTFLDIIDDMKSTFNLHFVIVDTNPTLTVLDSYVYIATDAYVYVTEAERLSSEAVDQAISQIKRVASSRIRHLNRDTRVLGIIPNKVRLHTAAHQTGLDELKERYGMLIWPEVSLRTAWVEASLVGQLVYNYAPSSSASSEAWEIVKHVVESIKQWQSETS